MGARAALTAINVMVTPKTCIRCHERPATRPTSIPTGPCYCHPCWQAMPCNQRAQSTRNNPKRRAYVGVINKRRIYIGRRYVGYAKTADQARAINDHARRRLHEFEQGFKARAQAEGDPVGAVPPEATPGSA